MEGSFAHSLDTARNTSAPVCLIYAFRVDRNGVTWVALNHEHWASFISPKTKTRYIGYIKNDLPHGAGSMAYVNGFSYTGDWCQGKRGGNGILVRDVGRASMSLMSSMKEAQVPSEDRILFEGLWIEDKKAQEGKLFEFEYKQDEAMVEYVVPVEVTIYLGAGSIATATFCIQNGPGSHTQVETIAKVFNWKSNERYSLIPSLQVDNQPGIPGGVVKSNFSIFAKGSQIEWGPYPDASMRKVWDWPNETVTWKGKSMTSFDWSRNLRPFPPVMGPDPTAPTKLVLHSARTRPIKIEAVLLP